MCVIIDSATTDIVRGVAEADVFTYMRLLPVDRPSYCVGGLGAGRTKIGDGHRGLSTPGYRQ